MPGMPYFSSFVAFFVLFPEGIKQQEKAIIDQYIRIRAGKAVPWGNIARPARAGYPHPYPPKTKRGLFMMLFILPVAAGFDENQRR